MNRGRGTVDPPLGRTGSPLQRDTGPSKTNRLRRSFRPTETAKDGDSPRSQQPEFKTPTRVPRSRAGSGFTAESPNNDSDFQQDIIWDATSPSPSRLGKRGMKQKPPGAVDISDIVSRIAPKYGRPTVAEPTLQQWIGDSAAIPCTPDVQVPRPKKKSPRPNGVDDLLKLAKQFDFNMFHQDEEEAEDMHQQSLELLSEDIFNNDRSNASPALPSNRPPAATEKQLHPDQHMEDDLDFLFDGPTQRFSGNLSQLTQVKPPKEAPGKPEDSSHGPAAGVSGAGAKVALAKDEFEDDWENDDLLNDSLVLEMTQNPQKFCSPQHCSTQKAAGHMTHESPASAVVRSPVSNGHSRRQRTTFKLESNPGFSLGGIQKNGMVDFGPKQSVKDGEQSGRCPGNGVSVEAGSRSWQTPNPVASDPRQTEIHRRASVARYDAAASKASSTTMGRSFPTKPAPVASTAAASDLPHEDLEELFSSDPVWDDEADDDLLCEICEVVENRLQGAEGAPPPGGHLTTQRASLPPSNGSQQPAYRQPFDPKRQTPGLAAVGSWTAGSASNTAAGARVTDSSQTKGPSATACGSAWTFKKPGGPVATVTVKDLTVRLPSAAGGSCSAAEIERKKQQAMERRRQRMQAAQNLRAPT